MGKIFILFLPGKNFFIYNLRKNKNISLLPKDKQEVIDFYEQFGQITEKRDIQWKGT